MKRARDYASATNRVCDVCQELQAVVMLGCVEYCARCAPSWHGEVGERDGDEDGDEEEAA